MWEQDTMSKRCVTPLFRVCFGLTTVQSTADATVHYKGKVEFVTKNLESLQEAIQKKQDNLNYLVSIVQSKAAEEREQASTTVKPT
jgi:prefoldin alpha subunit